MFAWWGRMVYRFRYAVIGVMVALCLGAGAFGISLGKHVTQSGFYDNGSQSVHASVTADQVYGRDTSGHIVAIYTAPEGKTVDDPAFQKKILDNLAQVEKDHPDQILRSIGYFKSPQILTTMADADKQHGFMSIQLKGNDDDTILNNYKAVEGDFNIPGVDVKITGLEPLAAALTGTIGEDQKRAEVAAIPLVCVVLFFVFGTVVAAALPGLIGALTIMGALGIMRLVAEFVPVNFFAQPVVTLMGLGIAVDYGLFIVSRFREEIAEGYDTEAAVRRTVMTSGRTVMFSAVILVASSVPLLLIPLDFLKSITYAIIASVMLAAILSITVLAAILAILGPRVDAVGVKMLVRFAEPDPIISDPANPRSNPLALASIPVGILLPPLGIAFGHIARSRIRTSGERGAGLALIGLVLGYVSLMSALGYGVIALRDAGTIEGTLYWILLGVVIFVSVVIGGLALARAVPLIRGPIVWWLNWLADKTQKTKTRAEVEKGFWGKLVNVVMKRPAAFAVPIVIVMIALIIPLGNLALGGISEKYLPPDNSVRQAQQEFDKIFPGFRTDPLTLVIESKDGQPVTDPQIAEVRNQVMAVSGFVDPNNDPAKMWQERPYLDGASKNPSVRVLQNALTNPTDAPKKMAELRALPPPRGLSVSVGGTPALAQDGIQSLYDKLPVMLILLISTTTVLMFLAFGSLVLPIKAAVMSALTLGSTMGALTWMFIDGHGSGLMNYTPQPLMAPMIGLIIAVIWGLSTDYEVFLVSRMVEARARGMSTAEAIRIGTATTGRLITGAALVLAVVAGAFVFSDLVMMKYLAFGLLIALLLDATVVRMFLVPAIMKMLGDDCWWAPQWMKRIQERLGLGEVELPDERKRPTAREAAPDSEALVGAGAPMRALPAHDPTHPQGAQRSIAAGNVAPQRVSPPSAAGTTRIPTAAPAPVAEPPTTRMPAVPADQTTRMPAAPAEVSTTRTPRVDPSRTSGPHRAPAPARGSTGRGSSATGSREIESWLGDLRGGGAEAAQQGDAKRPPTTGRRQPPPPPAAEPPTTAIPTQRPTEAEPTEKIDLRSEKHEVDENPKRRGGGVSAADLLRREGRL